MWFSLWCRCLVSDEIECTMHITNNASECTNMTAFTLRLVGCCGKNSKSTICIDPIFHNSFFFSLSFSHRLVFMQSIWIEITLNRCMVHTTMYEGEQISIHCLRAFFLSLLLFCLFFFVFHEIGARVNIERRWLMSLLHFAVFSLARFFFIWKHFNQVHIAICFVSFVHVWLSVSLYAKAVQLDSVEVLSFGCA